jgi:hypothetical protein
MDLPMTISLIQLTEKMCHSVEITAHRLNMLEMLVNSFADAVDGAIQIKTAASTNLVLMLLHVHQPT